MEVGRFSEAAQDFTFVIRYEPRVAGFYDNRQNAYRRSGQFDLALLDANMAIQLTPGYSFVYQVERMSTMIWENLISQSGIITKRLN
jgi:tetratricopeptide (TPR) repeat protein